MGGDNWTLRRTLYMLLFIAGAMTMTWSFLIIDKPRDEWLGAAMWVLPFGLFIFLGVRFEAVHHFYEKGLASYISFCVVATIGIMPMVIMKWMSDLLLDHAPWPVQVGALVLWALLLGVSISLIATKDSRAGLLSGLARVHLALPAAYGMSALLLACLFFSSASVLMAGRGWLTFTASSSMPVSAGALTDFYLWHFLNAVPVLKITETLKWSAPLQYESARVGWILLLFKFTVIGPLIATFAWYGTRAKAPDRETPWPFLYRPTPRA